MERFAMMLRMRVAKFAEAVRRARRARADAAEWQRRCEILSNVLADTLKQGNL